MKVEKSNYHLSYYHILIYVISHLWSGIDSEILPGYSITVPRHVTVQRGLCVYIPCSFTVPATERLTGNAKGKWINTKAESVASRRYNQYENNGRFFLVGEVWRGDCSLYIENPLFGDEGHYRFRVEDIIKFSYKDIQPYVEVTDLNKPEISPIKSWLEGEEVTLRCTSPGTCLGITPLITWRGNIQNERVENKVETHENDTKTHFSTITFIARKKYNNSPLSCTVQLKLGLATVQQITMDVGNPPRVPEIRCSITNRQLNIPSRSGCTIDATNTIYRLEGSRLFLTCSADSVPESFLVWKSSNGTLTSFSKDKLIFTNMSLTDEGTYTCQATNVHGSRETSVTIKITYPPRAPEIRCFITNREPNIPSSSGCTMDANNTIYPPEGSQLSLTCSADSVPESSLMWKSSTGIFNSSSTDKLNFTHMSFTDEGIYTCQATNAHGSRETSVTTKMTYKPKITEGRCRKVEKRLECTCSSQSFPEPTLTWKHNGVSYNNSNHMNAKISIFTQTLNSVTNSTLTLQVNTEESQNIQCVTSNIHGEHVLELFNETVQLTSKGFPSAAVFGGCIAAVLIVIGVLLIIFYRKRKITQNKEASRLTQADVVDHIYGNSEMFFNGPHEVPQQDHQPPPEDGSVHLNCQDLQYMSVNFSKLKPRATETDTDAEEIEYSVVKRTD